MTAQGESGGPCKVFIQPIDWEGHGSHQVSTYINEIPMWALRLSCHEADDAKAINTPTVELC